MRTFVIMAHNTGATWGGEKWFTRTITAKSKALAIGKFFDEYGPFNCIEKIIELSLLIDK